MIFVVTLSQYLPHPKSLSKRGGTLRVSEQASSPVWGKVGKGVKREYKH